MSKRKEKRLDDPNKRMGMELVNTLFIPFTIIVVFTFYVIILNFSIFLFLLYLLLLFPTIKIDVDSLVDWNKYGDDAFIARISHYYENYFIPYQTLKDFLFRKERRKIKYDEIKHFTVRIELKRKRGNFLFYPSFMLFLLDGEVVKDVFEVFASVLPKLRIDNFKERFNEFYEIENKDFNFEEMSKVAHIEKFSLKHLFTKEYHSIRDLCLCLVYEKYTGKKILPLGFQISGFYKRQILVYDNIRKELNSKFGLELPLKSDNSYQTKES